MKTFIWWWTSLVLITALTACQKNGLQSDLNSEADIDGVGRTLNLALRDPSTSSVEFTKTNDVGVEITGDSRVNRWCLSEAQTSAPKSTTSACTGGAGSLNGWASLRPSTITLSGGDAQKVVYLWVSVSGKILARTTVTHILVDHAVPTITFNAVPLQTTNAMTAQFDFSGADTLSGLSGFECSLDGAPATSCVSPKIYSTVNVGTHTFQVRSLDKAGNASAYLPFIWTVQPTATPAPTPAPAMTPMPTPMAYTCPGGIICGGTPVIGIPDQVVCGTDFMNWICTPTGWKQQTTSCICIAATPMPIVPPQGTPGPTPVPIPISTPAPMTIFSPPAGSPLASHTHPRLWLSTQNIAEVKARLASGGEGAGDLAIFLKQMDDEFATPAAGFYYGLPNMAMNYAFLYATYPISGAAYTHSKAEYGARAKSLAIQYLSIVPVPSENRNEYGVAFTLDWAHDLFSAAEEQTIINWMKGIDAILYGYYNPLGSLHGVIWPLKVSFALSCFGDGVDDVWCQDGANRYYGWYRDPHVSMYGVRAAILGDDGGCTSGCIYDMEYIPHMMVMGDEAWRTANNISRAEHYGTPITNYLKRLPQKLAYITLPWPDMLHPYNPNSSYPNYYGFSPIKFNENYAHILQHPASEAFTWLSSIRGIYKDVDPDVASLAQWIMDNITGHGRNYYDIQRDFVLFSLISGRYVTPKSPEQLLPKSKESKDGYFYFRTGWNSMNDSQVTFLGDKWLFGASGRGPYNPGGFTIDRKGPQVMRFAYGGHGCGSHGGGSSNNLYFPDRTDMNPADESTVFDQGQHRRATPNGDNPPDMVAAMIEGSVYDCRGTLRSQLASPVTGMDVDYVYADITRAYSSTLYTDDYNSTKVSNVVRQFVYFHPERPGIDSDRVIVFDRTATVATKFEKVWMLHTSGTPIINGTESPGPARLGSAEGKWTYTGATEVHATNTEYGSNGTTYLTPLLPSNFKIVKVGGPNSQGINYGPGSHEFESAYGNACEIGSIPAEEQQYVGHYRVEVIPATPALDDVFLNVIEVGDAGAPKSPTALLSGSLAAARVGNRIASFNRIQAYVSSGNFTIDLAGSYKVLIGDLTPGATYSVNIGGQAASYSVPSSGSLFIPVTVSGGTAVTLTKQ